MLTSSYGVMMGRCHRLDQSNKKASKRLNRDQQLGTSRRTCSSNMHMRNPMKLRSAQRGACLVHTTYRWDPAFASSVIEDRQRTYRFLLASCDDIFAKCERAIAFLVCQTNICDICPAMPTIRPCSRLLVHRNEGWPFLTPACGCHRDDDNLTRHQVHMVVYAIPCRITYLPDPLMSTSERAFSRSTRTNLQIKQPFRCPTQRCSLIGDTTCNVGNYHRGRYLVE